MSRLVLQVDYSTRILFPTSATSFIMSLDGAILVKEEGYGAERRLVPVADAAPFIITLEKDDSIALPDVGAVANPFVGALAASQKREGESNLRAYAAEKALKAAEDKLAALQQAVAA